MILRRLFASLTLAALPACNAEVGAAERAPNGPAERDARHVVREPLFSKKDDARLRRSLGRAEIVRVEKGRGGRSLSFKLMLSDGTRAYYKPEQSFAAYWYSEIASYHLDRELGLRRVAPVISRRVPWSTLSAAAGRDDRVSEIEIGADGTVRGAMVAWIEGELPPLDPPRGWESWLRIEDPPRVSPFQRVNRWRQGRTTYRASDSPSAANRERPAELSDLVVFDYLIGNLDRWGGDFTNVRTLGDGGPLVFLDNANGFEPGRVRTKLLDARLHAVQRFRKRTLEALRTLDLKALERRLAKEPLSPILSEAQLEAVDVRRKHVLAYARELERRFGKRAVPW